MQDSLTELQKSQAKQKAISFLENSIYELALQLGVDVLEINSSYDIPVEESEPTYKAHLALVEMQLNLERLLSEE
jgi:hypothetical protein